MCGSVSIVTRLQNVGGSDSSALTHRYVDLAIGRQEGPLHTRRETGPAATAQIRLLDELDQFIRGHLQRLGRALVAAGLFIHVDRRAVGHVDVSHEYFFKRHVAKTCLKLLLYVVKLAMQRINKQFEYFQRNHTNQ
jgi:hypothetical protein